MMSGEDYEDLSRGQAQMKRRRMRGSCDHCRQRKIRCDSSKRPGKRCTNCVTSESECTHVYMTQKVGQPYRSSRKGLGSGPSQPLSLAQLQESMDPLLKAILHPTYQSPTNSAVTRETLVNLARYSRALEAAIPAETLDSQATVPAAPLVPTYNNSSDVVFQRDVEEASEDEPICALLDRLKRSLMLTDSKDRFLGPSSTISFVLTAKKMNEDNPGQIHAVTRDDLNKYMRPQYWSVLPWEIVHPPNYPPFHFPESDLMDSLIELYFVHFNNYTPLLHRPTFEKAVSSGLHISNPAFGGTVLAVCALASRFSTDPRVLLEGTESLHSCGFKWYRQLRFFHESSLRAPSLYELQTLCLAAIYLEGSSTPEKSWYLTGLGIRASHDIGLNRKCKNDDGPTVMGELRKRVFWALIVKETELAVVAGRPPSTNSADFDLDLPIACDDEYWETSDPELAFKQPSGTPSRLSFFNIYLKLLNIHCTAFRFFYAVNRPSPPKGISADEWEKTTLADINSALNAWFDSIPEYLRWDPQPSDPVFFNQSAILFSTFYHTRVLMYRTLIKSQDSAAMSSLAICTDAAKECIRIMEIQTQKGIGFMPQFQSALFGSALVLLLGMWKKRDMASMLRDDNKELSAVVSCIKIMKVHESRWHLPGRFCDVLMALLATKGLSLPLNFTTDFPDPIAEQPADNTEPEIDSQRDAPGPTEIFHNAQISLPETAFDFPLYATDLNNSHSKLSLSQRSGNLALQQQQSNELGLLGLFTQSGSNQGELSNNHLVQPSYQTLSPPSLQNWTLQRDNTNDSIFNAAVSSGYQWDDLIHYIESLNNVQDFQMLAPSGQVTLEQNCDGSGYS